MATLKVQYSDGTGDVHSLDRDLLTFGSADGNDLVLQGRSVSRQHGRFFCDRDGKWRIEDLGSTNGTLVAGRFVTQHQLRNNDQITVGELTLTFQAESAGNVQAPTGAVTITDAAWAHESTVEQSPRTLVAMDSKRLTALYEISKRLLDQRDVDGLIDEASAALVSTLDAEVVVFGLTCDPEHEGDRLVVRPARMQQADVTLSRSVLRRTVDARQAVLVTDTKSDHDLLGAQSIMDGGIRSAMCVPMMRGQDVTGFIYVDSRRHDQSYNPSDLEFACAVGAMVGTAIENTRLHEAELVRQRLEAELAGARRVQQAIMPSSWPELPGWDIYGQHWTCHEVGGDYYDAIVTAAGSLWLVIADVCGKGAPAALLASSMYTAVHVLVDQCRSPGQLLTRLNGLLLQRELESSFVSCLAVMVTPDTGDVLLASAGHPYPIRLAEDGLANELTMSNDLILGVNRDTRYSDTPWSFPASGETLLMYTDGVTEAVSDQSEQFGEQRLVSLLSKRTSHSPAELIDTVQHAVEEFRSNRQQTDDLTLLACRRRPGS